MWNNEYATVDCKSCAIYKQAPTSGGFDEFLVNPLVVLPDLKVHHCRLCTSNNSIELSLVSFLLINVQSDFEMFHLERVVSTFIALATKINSP